MPGLGELRLGQYGQRPGVDAHRPAGSPGAAPAHCGEFAGFHEGRHHGAHPQLGAASAGAQDRWCGMPLGEGVTNQPARDGGEGHSEGNDIGWGRPITRSTGCCNAAAGKGPMTGVALRNCPGLLTLPGRLHRAVTVCSRTVGRGFPVCLGQCLGV